MRLFALMLIVASFAAVPAALAEGAATGDGSLVVSNANALTITVAGSGVIFGHIQQGTLTIVDYTPGDGGPPQVSGAATRVAAGKLIRYFGSDVRFLFPAGKYTLKFEGFGIGVSAVGKGFVSSTGLGTPDDGTMATNGGKPLTLDSATTMLVFGANKSPNALATGKGPR
jgi:hypothetical protein